jgi:NAD(P)-dependent dehydrogenase (short-subunit alcohol dehydrogenase family)
MRRIEGEVAIVTGGSRGIGEAIARLFCAEGAKVCIAGINEEEGQSVVKELNELGHEALFVKCDVSDDAQVHIMVKQCDEQFGPPTILINNAGIADISKKALDMTDAQWRRNFAVDLDGVWFCCRAVLPYMEKNGRGSIVNIGSVHSFKIVPEYFPYPVVKHAVIGLTRSLAVEFGTQNIRVNALCPGCVETDICKEIWARCDDPEEERKRVGAVHPLKRNAQPVEIAYPALFLASKESSFMTGESMMVDGGRSVVYHD